MKPATAEKAAPPEPKRRGRPPGATVPPELQRKPRSVRLDDARADKLRALGSEWLERQIDRAKLPG